MDITAELKLEFDKKFISPEMFAHEIEKYVKDNGYDNYISAITDYCEDNNIDIESVPKLLSKQFKQKIEFEAASLNCLKVKAPSQLVF